MVAITVEHLWRMGGVGPAQPGRESVSESKFEYCVFEGCPVRIFFTGFSPDAIG